MYNHIRSIFVTFIWLFFAVLLFISLMSYSANDPSWSHASNVASDVSNMAGWVGAWLSDILYTFLGIASWWFVVIACYEAWRTWFTTTEPHGVLRTLGYLFIILTSCALCGVLPIQTLPEGVIGSIVAQGLSNLLTPFGAFLFIILFLVITIVFSFDIAWQKWLAKVPFLQKYIKFEPEAESILDEHDATSEQLSSALLEGLEEANADIIQPVVSKQDASNVALANSPLDDFLDETGFSQTKEFEWMDSNDGSNPFKPISSAYLANSKLTKKLNAKLQGETIVEKPANNQSVKTQTPKNTQPETQKEPSKPTQTATITPTPTRMPATEKTTLAVAKSVEEQDIFGQLMSATSQLQSPAPKINIQLPKATDIAPPSEEPFYYQPMPEIDESDSVETDESSVPSVADILGMRKIVLPPRVSSNSTTVDASISADLSKPMPEKIEPVKVEQIIAKRKVESVYFDEPQQVLDIHNDELFVNQSRAMQTAQHRASLSPLPPFDLLDLPDPNQQPSYTQEQLKQLSELLEIKLQDFNIKAQVVNAQLGPVVTRFEVELAPGVKASKVTGIAKDLARSLSMASVRVVEVIPGKPYIGIEVPNPKRQMVRLIELLQTEAYQDPTAHLSMAMGKDIAGRPVITDLAKAPHMLVAGTTGSGKSVLVNSLLLSLLLKYTPNNLRLILIDPKQLELANYNDIPHLLTPVVTDMNEATSALAWCVAEMERRYQLMALFKVRKLDEFNKKIIVSEQQGQPLLDPLWRIHDTALQDKPPKLKPLPQIVIVADEFADMIMQIGKQAEELITRLAQKSRAAGIHLVLATQRPSVDVITGLIKANIPVRSALRVNSKVDSRTILDAGGAEDMLGHGDMLFLGPGQIEPNRVHGAFISDAEVNRICDAWRERGAPDYIDNMFDNFQLTSSNTDDNGGGSAGGADDPLYDEVVAFVMESRKASTSSIQRKFSIGYNRAGRIMDAMEEAGLVSAMGKSGKRELLV